MRDAAPSDRLDAFLYIWTMKEAHGKATGAGLSGALQVFIRTNPFKPDAPQYQRGLIVPLAAPSDDTLYLLRAAQAAADLRRPIVIFPQGTRVAPGVAAPLRSIASERRSSILFPTMPSDPTSLGSDACFCRRHLRLAGSSFDDTEPPFRPSPRSYTKGKGTASPLWTGAPRPVPRPSPSDRAVPVRH